MNVLCVAETAEMPIVAPKLTTSKQEIVPKHRTLLPPAASAAESETTCAATSRAEATRAF